MGKKRCPLLIEEVPLNCSYQYLPLNEVQFINNANLGREGEERVRDGCYRRPKQLANLGERKKSSSDNDGRNGGPKHSKDDNGSNVLEKVALRWT